VVLALRHREVGESGDSTLFEEWGKDGGECRWRAARRTSRDVETLAECREKRLAEV
jgi:hypothetical protein